MKKLAVLVVLLAMAALPLMAEVTLSGNVEYGFATNFDTEFTDGFGTAPDYNFVKLAAKVDDFNTANVEIQADPAATGNILYAYLSSDLGAAFGLKGTGLKMDIGRMRPANERYSVGGYWSDRAYSFRPGYRNAVDLVLSPMNKFNVEVAFTPEIFDAVSSANQALWLGAYGTFGPVSAEAFYFAGGAQTGQIGVAAKAALAPSEGVSVTFVPSFMYDLDSTAANAWAWGAGLAGSVSMVSATANVKGNETNALSRLAFTVTLTPVEKLSLNAGAMFNMDEGAAETFDNFDVAAVYSAGAASLQLGYLYTKTGAAAGGPGWINGPVGGAADLDGGLHFDVNIAY